LKTKALKTACLAVGLATAWGSPANAGPSQSTDEVQLTISPSNNLTHVYFLYGVGGTTPSNISAIPLPDIVGGITTTDTFSAANISSPAYAVMGLYDETNKLLTLSLYSGEAQNINGNADFSDVFSPFTENTIATALLSNDTATLVNFIGQADFWTVGFGSSADLINFSNASDGGSVFAAIIVPEPSSSLLVGFGALAILTLHRKRGRPRLPVSERIRGP
jgi:hypothetical protein